MRNLLIVAFSAIALTHSGPRAILVDDLNLDLGPDFIVEVDFDLDPEIPDIVWPEFIFQGEDLIRPLSAVELDESSTDIECLALNVYHEARGSTIDDQVATAWVVLNRVDSWRWPNDVCSTVYQPWQFSWTMDSNSEYPYEREAWKLSQAVAYAVYHNLVEDPTNGATHYHRWDIRPRWTVSDYQHIGAHFYMIAD